METTKENQVVETQLATQNKTAIKKMGDDIATSVLDRVKDLQEGGQLVLPNDYKAGNALKSAWLYLQTIETRDKKRALDACTKDSIANCLLEMVVRGEHPMQHCYFIPTGNQLTFWERYTGKLMRAKRDTDIASVNAQVVYEKDNFVYTVDDDGLLQLVKHETSLANIDNSKIVGAYAVVVNKDGSKRLEVMTMDMIRKAWEQGSMKGGSGAHRNFTDQMAKKTVIARACKIALDSTKDGYKEEAKETMQQHDDDEVIEVVSESESQPARLEEHHDDFEEAATAATEDVTAANNVRACPI